MSTNAVCNLGVIMDSAGTMSTNAVCNLGVIMDSA